MPGWPAILDFRGCTGLPHSDGSVDRARASTPPVANELKRSSKDFDSVLQADGYAGRNRLTDARRSVGAPIRPAFRPKPRAD